MKRTTALFAAASLMVLPTGAWAQADESAGETKLETAGAELDPAAPESAKPDDSDASAAPTGAKLEAQESSSPGSAASAGSASASAEAPPAKGDAAEAPAQEEPTLQEFLASFPDSEQAQACFASLPGLPRYQDEVELSLSLLSSGAVEAVRVVSTKPQSPGWSELRACLSKLLERKQFAPQDREGASFSLTVRPLKFEEQRQGLAEDARLGATWKGTQGQLFKCRDQAADKAAEPEGKVVVGFDVLASGEVDKVELRSSELKDQAVERCITRSIDQSVFPASEDSRARSVEFTQVFAPEKETPLATSTAVADKEMAPWGINVGLGMSSSMLLFSPTRYVRSYYASLTPSLSVGGRLKLAEQINATAMIGASFELTTPNDPSGRRFNWSDPSFGVSHASLFKDETVTGINISGGAALSLGLSLPSLTATQLFALNGNLTASRTFLSDKLGLSLTVAAGAPFNRYKNGVVKSQYSDGVNKCLVRPSGAEAIGSTHCATGGQNTKATAGATLGLSYQATAKLGVSANFGLMHTWNYAIKVDALSPKVLDSKGNLVVDGSSGMDVMIGGFEVNYALPKGYGLVAGFNTGGAPFAYYNEGLDSTNKSLRFPFWDPRLMRTSFFLNLSRSF